MTECREILCAVAGRVATLQLNRPDKRNALTEVMRHELIDSLTEYDSDGAISVVVITGAGESFCAGLDRDELLSKDPAQRIRTADSSRRFHRAILYFSKPLVAAVDGHALGTGFDLALMCDGRIATERAQFGHPEVPLGAVPLDTPLKDVVGAGWARELCLTGRRIDGKLAKGIGLVTDLVEPGDLLAAAQGKAEEMAAVPLDTLQATKALFADRAYTERWLVSEHDDVFAAGLTIR
jgi:3-hydroxypropionyl-coenzyme A dehydratase